MNRMPFQESVSTLSETQMWLLNSFINRFLLQSNNKRKYNHNELFFVHCTISKIFFRFLKIKITSDDLLLCFAKSGYKIYISDKPAGHVKQNNRLCKKYNNIINSLSVENEYFIYIGISSTQVINLKESLGSIAYQKNQLKIVQIASLKKEIHDFFNWNARITT